MSLAIGLRHLLEAEATITTLLARTLPRLKGIYNDHATQGAKPSYIIITDLGHENNNTLDGDLSLRFSSIDIDCKAKTRIKAKALARAVYDYLHNYTGDAGGETTIKAVIFEDELDDYEEDDKKSDGGLFVTTLDFTIQYVLT